MKTWGYICDEPKMEEKKRPGGGVGVEAGSSSSDGRTKLLINCKWKI